MFSSVSVSVGGLGAARVGRHALLCLHYEMQTLGHHSSKAHHSGASVRYLHNVMPAEDSTDGYTRAPGRFSLTASARRRRLKSQLKQCHQPEESIIVLIRYGESCCTVV